MPVHEHPVAKNKSVRKKKVLKIRLTRVGKKKHPEYRIVVIPKENAAQGLYIERLGHWNPHTKQLTLDKEKVSAWMTKGARPTNTVAKLFKKEGVELPKWVEIVEKKRAPKGEKKEETPAAPKVEGEAAPEGEAPAEPAAETPAEEPKAEAKEETTAEEPKEEPKAEEVKVEDDKEAVEPKEAKATEGT